MQDASLRLDVFYTHETRHEREVLIYESGLTEGAPACTLLHVALFR